MFFGLMIGQKRKDYYRHNLSWAKIECMSDEPRHPPGLIRYPNITGELTLCLPVSSADNLGKQFGPRSGPTIRLA